ncbi:MAG: hypothetical protein ACI94Y_001803 [Maribacter sp.]|jgi:hypothetical protein
MNTTIKTPPPAFIKVDEIIQRILGILILLTLIIFPIAMLLLIPFGAWQVVSGIVGALHGSKWRMKYLGFVVLYFSTLFGFAWLGDSNYLSPYSKRLLEDLFAIIYCVSPLIMGLTYFVKTRKERPKEEGVSPKWKDMDDVLDIDMVG